MEVKTQDLAKRLKAAREQRGLTQAELANAAGLQQSAVARLETGHRKPAIDTLCRLAVALEVSTDHLLGIESEEGAGSPKAAAVHRIMQDLSEDDLELLRVLAAAMRKRPVVKGKRSRKK